MVTTPVVSVRPYTCTKLHLKVLSDAASTCSEIGDAPYAINFRLEKSALSTSGTINVNASNAGTMNAWVMRC